MKLNQFAVYRVDQQTAGKALWHLPYQEARQQNVSITVENYRVISIHEMQEEEKVADIWKRMKNWYICTIGKPSVHCLSEQVNIDSWMIRHERVY